MQTCRIAIAPDRFEAEEMAFGLRKGSSLLKPLNEQIQKMAEGGIFAAAEKAVGLGKKACRFETPRQRPVKIGDLQG
ncbi:unnamed protein product, partial [Larinioides sclopetarius]